jgi:hypothetical protein
VPDLNGVLRSCYDPAVGQLNVTIVGGASNRVGNLDDNGVWDAVYDPATKTIRLVLA